MWSFASTGAQAVVNASRLDVMNAWIKVSVETER